MSAQQNMKAIAAMSLNRVIGLENQIPWHLPEDFKWFKAKTMGHTLVMGRKTYESIGRPLPGRRTVVMSRQSQQIEGVESLSSLGALRDYAADSELYICGGVEIYEQLLPYCSELFLTLIDREVQGDAFFPEFESIYQLQGTLKETNDFKVLHYVNPTQQAL